MRDAADPDIASEIWARTVASHEGRNLDTAEVRTSFDAALRRELAAIDDIPLREHTAELLRARRRTLFALREWRTDASELAKRVEAIEAFLGLKPRQPEPSREITNLRPSR